MQVDTEKLGKQLEQKCPEIVFALLHGSGSKGELDKNSDIDIAVFLSGKEDLDFYKKIYAVVEKFARGRDIDVGVLNNADPVYRFEALKGYLLMCRDKDKFAEFFSRTCREYEYQIADYQRQKQYRKKVHQRG
jgi:predicted nucleotidyltransferase